MWFFFVRRCRERILCKEPDKTRTKRAEPFLQFHAFIESCWSVSCIWALKILQISWKLLLFALINKICGFCSDFVSFAWVLGFKHLYHIFEFGFMLIFLSCFARSFVVFHYNSRNCSLYPKLRNVACACNDSSSNHEKPTTITSQPRNLLEM